MLGKVQLTVSCAVIFLLLDIKLSFILFQTAAGPPTFESLLPMGDSIVNFKANVRSAIHPIRVGTLENRNIDHSMNHK